MLTVFELTNPLTPAVNLDAPIERAATMFDATPFSMLPVVRDGNYCGVVQRCEVEKLPGYSGARVKDLLCRDMICLSPLDMAEIAAGLLSSEEIDIVPVVDDEGLLLGIVTAEDIPSALWHLSLCEISQN